MITDAKLHIFRQIAPIYNKKCYARFRFCLVAMWIVEQIMS